MSTSPPPAEVSSVAAGLRCRCPRCGKGALFTGAFSLDVNAACEKCGLELKRIDPGDGPAVFAILLLGFLMLGSALIVEFKFSPPLWVHMALWTPVTLFMAFGLLRPLKGLMIALQFHHKVAPGDQG